MGRSELNDIKFGPVSSKMEFKTPLVNISASEINLPDPPLNDSQTTLTEINRIRRAVKDRTPDEETFIHLADDNMIDLFKSAAVSNDLKFDERYFIDLKRQLSPLAMGLKFRYNRPRPYQVAEALKLDFDYSDLPSAKTPAYPSGHAIHAHSIANVLSFLYPRFDRVFRNLADRISLSRIQAGVHYPSDIAAGEEVANMIEPYIRSPYDVSDDTAEHDLRSITRSFLNESYRDNPEKLRILDFDDTLADTIEMVRVETQTGHKMITSSEFASYDFGPEEYLDPGKAFEEFRSVDIEKASPVPFISDLFKKFAGPTGTSRLLILTARDQSVEPFVIAFLEKKLGIEGAKERVDVIGVGSKDPVAKVIEIERYLDDHPSIQFISFYDDSGENVRAVKDFIDSIGIKGDVRQVIRDEETGDVKLIKPEDLSESPSLRSITRNFLQMI